jgi:hypothetical protein
MRRRGTALAAGALAALAVAGGQASAAVSCGKTVTKDVKLKKDLLGCPGDGLVAGAGNITIDLNGHRIDGQDLMGTSGVYVSGSYTQVLIKGHGRITDFDDGVELRGDNGRVKGITSKDNIRGIEVNEADDAKVRGNTILGSKAYGATASHAEDIEISGNEIIGPSVNIFTSAGIAVSGSDAPDTLIEDNVVRGGPEGDVGIWVFGDAPGTKIKSNEFRGVSGPGIQIYDGAAETVVKKNLTAGNGGDGIGVLNTAGGGNTVLKNTARKNNGDGIDVEKTGVQVGNNAATDNDGWGIIAAAPIDLGGNKAGGNGLGQCSGVVCS